MAQNHQKPPGTRKPHCEAMQKVRLRWAAINIIRKSLMLALQNKTLQKMSINLAQGSM